MHGDKCNLASRFSVAAVSLYDLPATAAAAAGLNYIYFKLLLLSLSIV